MSLLILKARAQQWAAVLRTHAEVTAVTLTILAQVALLVYQRGAFV